MFTIGGKSLSLVTFRKKVTVRDEELEHSIPVLDVEHKLKIRRKRFFYRRALLEVRLAWYLLWSGPFTSVPSGIPNERMNSETKPSKTYQ